MKVGVKDVVKIYVRSKIDEYLASRGTTKAWLGNQIGATRSQVHNWSKNTNGIAEIQPSIGYVLKMVKVLGCEVSDLYELVED